MNPTAVLLIVVAAFAHAGWNLSAKRAGTGGAVFVWLYATLTAVLMVPIAVVDVVVGDQHPSWTWLLALGVSGLLQVRQEIRRSRFRLVNRLLSVTNGAGASSGIRSRRLRSA